MGPHRTTTVVDYHTAGEPFRIVTGGVPPIPGRTILERRTHAQSSTEVDDVRKLLVNEPRGHADMYGGFLVPPDDDGADLGVLFWHKDGYSTACGHGTIALGTWAVEAGRVEATDNGDTDVVIDVPSGRVTARVTCRDGAVESVSFRNVPSYVVARNVRVRTTGGEINADISYGGAFYASVSAAALGLQVTPDHYADLITAGREIKWALNDTAWAKHHTDPRLDGIYGTILYDDLGATESGLHQKNVTVFADGEVDRSPCGSGTSARLTLLAEEGRLGDADVLTHESIVGTSFQGRIVDHLISDGRPAVVTEVSGSAYKTGQSTFTLDPRDPVGTGFTLR